MTKQIKHRIHVCPIGFEEDRIIKPAVELQADRVWLIVEENATKERGRKFIDKVTKALEKEGIETRCKAVTRGDLFDNLRGILEIFNQDNANEIHVNVSAGSKIQAIAGMMASMMFKKYEATPYYVEPERYGETPSRPQSFGVKDISDLPRFVMQKPNDSLIRALKIIKEESEINKKRLAEIAIKHKIIDAVNGEITQGTYAKLDSHIIRPLYKEWGYIKVTKKGRNHWITLTNSGKDVCRFLTCSIDDNDNS